MKKLTVIFALCASLFGCSSNTTPNADVQAMKEDFYTQVDEGNLVFGALAELDDTMIQDVYGIDPEVLEDYFVGIPMMNVQANEIAMFEVKEGHLDEVKQAVEIRLDALTEQWKMYLPAQLELVENAQTYENGNYYFMVISESADETIAFIQGYFQ